MNEQQAWNNFARTGKIEDYIIYTQIKNQNDALAALGLRGEAGAGKDPGPYYPGTGDWGKR